MINAIAHDTYWQQWEESVAAGNGEILYGKDGFDRIGRCKHHYSQDYFWEIQLRPGFWLEFIDDEIHRSLSLLTEHDESMPLVSKFYLSGHHQVLTPNVKGVKREYEEKAGESYLFFGTTVFGYLQTCRMERAKQLLSERQLSIAAIAHTVGYASQSRFCHAFKQRYGMTPIACRRAL